MDSKSESLLGSWEGEPGFICVQDEMDAPAAFIIPHLLKSSLQDGYKVLFVMVDQTAEHYQMVMRKMTASLHTYLESQQLVLCDWLKEGRLTHEETSFQNLFQDILSRISKLVEPEETGKIALFVDCMSVVRSLHAVKPASDWVFFLQYCRSLGGYLGLDYRFVTLFHFDVGDDQDWLQWVDHVADVRITSRAIDVISVAGVDGCVEVIQRGVCPKQQHLEVDPIKTLYYKLRDTGIKFMSSIETPT